MIKKIIPILFFLIPFGVLSQQIDLLLLNEKFDKAIELIDGKIAQKPTAELYYKRSVAHQRLIDYPEALSDMTLALSLDSLNTAYYTSRADLYQSLGNYEMAVADYQTAEKLRPKDLLIKYDLGKILISTGDYRQALETFEAIQEIDSTNVMYNKYSAMAAYKAKKYKRAIDLYEGYLKQNPKDLVAYINLANAYESKGLKTRATRVYFKGLHQFPNNQILQLKAANQIFENKRYQVAQGLYHQYMQKYDTIPSVLLNYGICLYHNKMTEDAIDVLEKVYANNPNDVYVNFYLGVSHKRLKHYELAANYLDFAIYISIPEFHPEMYHHLAQVYVKEKEHEKAIECYKKAYELDNRKVEVLFELATVYEEFNYGKTLALQAYQEYTKEAGEGGDNINYALDRIRLIKEELFMTDDAAAN